MSARSATQVAVLAAGAAVTGLVGYAIYFDYMRRNNAEFRKGIRKQHKKIAAAAEARSKQEKERNTKALKAALLEIQLEQPPVTPEQQEAYFQEQVSEGEKLASMGPENYVTAATHFYRALRVYPQPVELLMIYQKVCPPQVFSLLLELTTLTGGAAGAASTTPPPPQASVADIDESSPATEAAVEAGSPNGASATSSGAGEWDRLSDEEKRA